MANKRVSFTDSELEIIKVVWKKGEATVDDVTEVLSKGRRRKYVTILTMMRILERKGFLTHRVDKRTYVYSPTVSEKRAKASILRQLSKKLFDGSKEMLLVALLDSEKMCPEEISRIKQLVEEKEGKMKK